ncbi:4-hydroxy-2-oxoheptanedioate aldolase [Marinobacterium lutimaris]|uniref:2,4-dihydroxyhept-2-enedioate aldolase n=1 Tax=Marinobacterium lutimaris TaxID=568106 RepID=A0A1H6AT21_9GAMM|nr:4-hydroxy-2-oxoheptanedioate aldolase [Marinobacterium lutimaris]SEG51833.1 2,4-dihydroxyhept-2-enedioate aldolase [Marinobacterium lutimaris]
MSNSFKQALAKGEAQIGFWLSMGTGYSAEMSATAGFNWLLIDNEHAPNDLNSTLAQLQAVAPYSSHPVVRVVQGDAPGIKKMLDIGVQTLLVPMIDTAEQAQQMVSFTRYPPEGIRGVGAAVARASRWNGIKNYVHQANDEVCLLVQAETVTALENLEAICAVDGVDGVFIGPADLAASMGHLGNPGHPDVQAAIDQAIKTIVASGKAAGTLTGDVAQARRFLELGATFVAVGLDVTLMMQATRARAAEFGLGEAPEATKGPY